MEDGYLMDRAGKMDEESLDQLIRQKLTELNQRADEVLAEAKKWNQDFKDFLKRVFPSSQIE